MNGHLIFNIGVAMFLGGSILMYWGNNLKSEENTHKIIEEVRKTADAKTSSNQVAIFQQFNNSFVFQYAKDELTPIASTTVNKREAKIIFSLPSFDIQNSHNVSSITDNGRGDVSIVFDEDFPNKNYYVHITGNQTINYKKIIKHKSHVRIIFEEENLEMIQIVCSENQ